VALRGRGCLSGAGGGNEATRLRGSGERTLAQPGGEPLALIGEKVDRYSSDGQHHEENSTENDPEACVSWRAGCEGEEQGCADAHGDQPYPEEPLHPLLK
jgi:hypothetical protein